MPVPRFRLHRKPMTERQLVQWLKSQGAIPTPPEIKRQLREAGYVGLPVEEINPFGD